MAYIIFLQPAILSGSLYGTNTGMDFGAVMTGTCLSAVIATVIMALYARYPIALAPGMGENFFFIFSAVPAAAAAGFTTNSWQVALNRVYLRHPVHVNVGGWNPGGIDQRGKSQHEKRHCRRDRIIHSFHRPPERPYYHS